MFAIQPVYTCHVKLDFLRGVAAIQDDNYATRSVYEQDWILLFQLSPQNPCIILTMFSTYGKLNTGLDTSISAQMRGFLAFVTLCFRTEYLADEIVIPQIRPQFNRMTNDDIAILPTYIAVLL